MPDYDSTRFSPPAPVALVNLRNPDGGMMKAGVIMLLDTGADVTLLPRAVADELKLDYSASSYELVGFENGSSVAHAVHAEMVFLGLTFRGQFLLVEQDWGIIGRNILNSVSVTYNGPKLSWDKS
ncbi:MAG: retroviral-like aspartic protease family protein [Acidobacteria bacterium]|nr:retroviral-like aspartic protease family protein [Acidobacteriota bacterium]